MKDISELINKEDKKNPLTDEEISKILGITRADVIKSRNSLKIGDSRDRRKDIMEAEMKSIISKVPYISEREMTRQLNEAGFKISRNIVSKYIKIMQDQVLFYKRENEKNNTLVTTEENEGSNTQINYAFDELIGFDGSLKSKVELSRAAILYPPNGLHTLIYGQTGVGKSQLAECMYKFAIESGVKEKESPFIVFNCADYAENPQLLLAQLFGYAKGAYTGAQTSKEGIVEMADNGILFLDEIHRLPPEGQEMLFYLIDKGKFRRLGENHSDRTVKIMIITATTEDPESSLLITFRRRIPMLIELPPLKDRPFYERYEIINQFLSKEAFRIDRTIIANTDVVRALMLYDCPGNIGQLRSDIQVACARSFLASIVSKKTDVTIKISHLPNHVSTGLFKINKREPEIDQFVNVEVIASPNNITNTVVKDDKFILPDNIYQFIEERFIELEKEGLTKDQINKVVGKQVEIELMNFVKNVDTKDSISKKEIQGIVGEKITKTVEKAIELAKEYFHDIEENLYYSLAIHISATYSRIISGKKIINPQLENILTEYVKEYEVAKLMADIINQDLGVVLPVDEIGFIAMYLRTFSGKNEIRKGRVGVIIITHGHVAMGMAEVANRLLGVDHAVGIEMSLDESPQSALEKTIEVVKSVDEGKGCIILVDMGSLITFGEIITKQTGIITMAVGRVDTVMVLEALRRALVEGTNLKEIVEAVDGDKHYVGRIEGIKEISKLPKAIITLCITGEGTALNIKKYIEDIIPKVKEKADIIPVGIIKQDDIEEEIKKLGERNNIIAIVGTINPNVADITFISFEELIKGPGINSIKSMLGISLKVHNGLEKIINEDLILCDLDATSKNEVIDTLVNMLQNKGYVDEQFMLSVYKRETMGATLLHNEVGIPHGYPEYVKKSTIAIAKLTEPIEWENGIKTDLIVLIAIKEDKKNDLVHLFKVFANEKIREFIRGAVTSKEILNIILTDTN
ncbi:sigma 54-interacting transcriptional regulator [Clostridium algoriphilum]|uniref:sigma 54-interacting transcriptional regulator n=1 Tax=Clostridium algoriphilum TaxID=198347 RepID=UPI001CF5411F|nr:sigma 54-interacting transcriptional regulator [Clostridium algoriphilum]MCB2295305.1 sigma 54-interacting transcriptional regulator [Clostridium algoriphilum]